MKTGPGALQRRVTTPLKLVLVIREARMPRTSHAPAQCIMHGSPENIHDQTTLLVSIVV